MYKEDKKLDAIINILESEMIPTLGCTDPAGIAYAAAYGRKYGRGVLISVSGELSANIIKNAAAVCIPKTDGKHGIFLATALGAVAGNADKGLEVFSDITEADVLQAEDFVAKGGVNLEVSKNNCKLYIKLTVKTEHDQITVTVEDSYTNITALSINGEILISNDGKEMKTETEKKLYYNYLSIENILGFAEKVSTDKLDIVKKAVEMNMTIAARGFERDYGISLGKKISDFIQQGVMSEDYGNIAMMWTSAATDARMAGCDMPVISNTGSGNQGLASTIPVIIISQRLKDPYEKMIRAVTISSLVTIYIKNKLGFLSAVCGATIAGAGAACGVVYLLGGRERHMLLALNSVLGDVAGMICDGAKAGCSMKIATCTHAAIMAALMAINNKGIQGTDGIVDDDEKETIDNFIKVATKGMEKMDQTILDIILKKEMADLRTCLEKPHLNSYIKQ